jgi:hypothetical protein
MLLAAVRRSSEEATNLKRFMGKKYHHAIWRRTG